MSLRKATVCVVALCWIGIPQAQHKILRDALGYSHILDAPPHRIISLAPNVTEILFALGLSDRVVGVTRFCNHPPEARAKPKIGGLVDPDIEKILSLKPDLLIGFRGNPLRVIQRLRDLHLSVFVLESGATLESVFPLIEKIGILCGKSPESDRLVSELKQKFQSIQNRLSDVPHIPRVFLSLHGEGLWTAGKNSFLNDLITQAKARNVAGEIARPWVAYNREELLLKDPEHIFILAKTARGFALAKEWWEKEPVLQGLQAVKRGRLHFLDEDLVSRPGPRIFQALEHMAHLLHPEAYKDPR